MAPLWLESWCVQGEAGARLFLHISPAPCGQGSSPGLPQGGPEGCLAVGKCGIWHSLSPRCPPAFFKEATPRKGIHHLLFCSVHSSSALYLKLPLGWKKERLPAVGICPPGGPSPGSRAPGWQINQYLER